MKLSIRNDIGLATLAVFAALLVVGTLARPAAAMVRRDVKRIVVEEAVRNGTVPPSLALAVARVESNFDPRARSSAGARGVMQIMPATARSEFGVPAGELWDARTNARLGVAYLEQLYRQYGYRWEHALSHYNGGTLKRNRRGRAVPHRYTRQYVARVMRASRRYERDVNVSRLVARSERREKAKAVSQPASDMPSEWMFDEPGVERDWRSFLEEADEWLGRAKERDSAALQATEEEPAYWDVWADSFERASADEAGGARPSDALIRRIDRSRARFRRHLNADGDGWRPLDADPETSEGESDGEPVRRARFM